MMSQKKKRGEKEGSMNFCSYRKWNSTIREGPKFLVCVSNEVNYTQINTVMYSFLLFFFRWVLDVSGLSNKSSVHKEVIRFSSYHLVVLEFNRTDVFIDDSDKSLSGNATDTDKTDTKDK